MVDYRTNPWSTDQYEWDVPPDEGSYTDLPVPADLYTRPSDVDPLAPPGLGPASGLSTRAKNYNRMPFVNTFIESMRGLPETVARAVDFPAAALRGEVDPLSSEGIARASDFAGTVTLGGGALPVAAPRGAVRSGAARTAPKADFVETPHNWATPALRMPNGDLYTGPMHGDIMGNLPTKLQNEFLDNYNAKNEGFIINKTGEYMDRDDAHDYGFGKGYIKETLSGRPSLSSEDLGRAPWDEDLYPFDPDDDGLYANRDKVAGAIPLAMDRESRMARAAEMGFNTDAYHGTYQNRDTRYSDELTPPEVGFQQFPEYSHFGTKIAAHDILDSRSLPAPANISQDSKYTGGQYNSEEFRQRMAVVGPDQPRHPYNIYPARLRGDFYTVPDMGTGWNYLKTPIRDLDAHQYAQYGLGKVLESLDVPLDKDGRGIPRGLDSRIFDDDWVEKEGLHVSPDMSIQDLLEDRGYTGVQYKNSVEDPGSISYMVFEPKRSVRSPWAKFESEQGDLLSANRSKVAGAVPIFSRLEREAEKLQPKAQGQQYSATLKNKGVPAEEVEWTGVADWLKERGTLPVTKEELLAQIQARQTQVGVKRLGEKPESEHEFIQRRIDEEARLLTESPDWDPEYGLHEAKAVASRRSREFADEYYSQEGVNESGFTPTQTRHSSHVLPGGENYREVLLTLPSDMTIEGKTAFQWDKEAEGLFGTWGTDPAKKVAWEKAIRNRDDLREKSKTTTAFTSSHWDEPNVLAHMRVNDRYLPNPEKTGTPTARPVGEVVGGTQWEVTLPGGHKKYVDLFAEGSAEEAINLAGDAQGGDRVLFAEEIQSDWHQKGRREGYKLTEAQEEKIRAEQQAYWDKMYDKGRITEDAETGELVIPSDVAARLDNYNAQLGSDSGVPNAPFKKSWPDLVLKRLVADAIDGGYDAIAWTDGATQADRYSLSKHVNSIDVVPIDSKPDGNLKWWPSLKSGNELGSIVSDRTGKILQAHAQYGDVVGRNISDVFGKDVADQGFKAGTEQITISGVDLDLGGEGMKAFYDQELPRRAKKLFGKWGAKVEESQLPKGDEKARQDWNRAYPNEPAQQQFVKTHILRITPEMRAAVQSEGLPLFANKSKAAGATVLAEAKSRLEQFEKKNGIPAFEPEQRWVDKFNSLPKDVQRQWNTLQENVNRLQGKGEDPSTIHVDDAVSFLENKFKNVDPKSLPEFVTQNPSLKNVVQEMMKEGDSFSNIFRDIHPEIFGDNVEGLLSLAESYGWRRPQGGVHANKSKVAGAATTVPNTRDELFDFLAKFQRKPITGGRFAAGGSVTINGETREIATSDYKKTLKGRPLSQNISNEGFVNWKNKMDPRSPDKALRDREDLTRNQRLPLVPPTFNESLMNPEVIMSVNGNWADPPPDGDWSQNPYPFDMEEMILRRGGDQFTDGLVDDDTPGRTDRLPTSMPADSYVIPADVVSGLGQGNTLAGASILDVMLKGHSTPSAKAEGGSVGSRIPVIVAGGEYIVSPDRVRSVGTGDAGKGHKILDAFVKKTRYNTAKRLQKLPGPAKD